jgi:hypothetical protein
MSSPEDEADEGFLSRWARRKRAEAEPLAEPPPAEAAPAPRPACPIPGVPEIDAANLPPIESLAACSDFLPFLRPGVPPLLRQAALRRMWSLDASIRDYIGPVEQQWHCNAPGGLLAQAIGLGDAAKAPEEKPAAAPAERQAEPAAVPTEQTLPDPVLAAAERSAIAAPGTCPEPSVPRRHGGALPA